MILFAIHLSERHWGDSLSRLWPMFAFVVGVVLSSHISSSVESTESWRSRSDGRWRPKLPSCLKFRSGFGAFGSIDHGGNPSSTNALCSNSEAGLG